MTPRRMQTHLAQRSLDQRSGTMGRDNPLLYQSIRLNQAGTSGIDKCVADENVQMRNRHSSEAKTLYRNG